jgi:hypothetical protein
MWEGKENLTGKDRQSRETKMKTERLKRGYKCKQKEKAYFFLYQRSF